MRVKFLKAYPEIRDFDLRIIPSAKIGDTRIITETLALKLIRIGVLDLTRIEVLEDILSF